MAFDPQEIRENFYSAPCAVCHAAVGATGVFKIRRDVSGSSWFGPFGPTHRPAARGDGDDRDDRRVPRSHDQLHGGARGITVEEEIVRPAVQQAVEDYQRNKRKRKGGA